MCGAKDCSILQSPVSTQVTQKTSSASEMPAGHANDVLL